VGGTPDQPQPAPYAARPLTPERVSKAADRGFTELDADRKFYEMACREFGGPWYRKSYLPNERPWYDKRPVNLISQMVEIYSANLVGSGHTVRLKPRRLGARGQALVRGKMLNQHAEKINLHRTHGRIVQDTILGGLGVYFTGLRAGSELYMVDGEARDPGQFFCVRVSLGDITRDPDSRDPEEDQFFGHRFRFNRATALETRIGDADAILSLDDLGSAAEAKDGTAPDTGRGGSTDRLNDLVEAWHLVLWDGSRTLTCVVANLKAGAKFIIPPHEYEGPERGPYELLTLRDMNNQTSPIAPSARLMDLHQATANAGTMIVDQILETDRKLVVKPEGGEELANDLLDRMKKVIKGDPELAKEFVRGGMVDKMMPGFQVLLGMAANEGLSLQQTGGSSSAADSATEASILAGRANVLLRTAKGKCNTALANVYRRMSDMLDRDEVTKATFGERLPGGLTLDLHWTPDMREGLWSDFTHEIQIEEIDTNDPNMEKVRTLELLKTIPGIVAGVVQTGGDPAAAIRIASDTFNKPELDEIWANAQAIQADQIMAQQAGQPTPPLGASSAQTTQNPIDPQDQRASDYSANVRV
jgi:hypothetical protein